MRRRLVVVGMLLLGAGCNRQDAECLGRIGNLVAHKLGELKPVATSESGLDRALPALIPAEENRNEGSRK